MSKTVTIELPDDLVQQLGVSDSSEEDSLQKIVLHTLTVLAKLMRSLQSNNPTVRAQAAKESGDMGAETAIIKLAEALTDPDLLVQHSAATALRSIGTTEAMTMLRKQDSMSVESSITELDYEPLLALAGTLKIGITDLGENHDDYIAEVLEAELHPDE